MITDAMVEAARNRLHRFGYTTIDRDMAQAALEAADREAWQPFETAPKDETPILACDARLIGVQEVVYWDRSDYPWATADGPNFHRDRFTHWRPLPSPPPNTAEAR